MVVANIKIIGLKKYTSNAGNIDCHVDTAVQYGVHRPDGAHPWLYAKPLDATIGRVPTPYHPSGRHGQQFRMKQKNTNKTQLLPSFLMVDWRKKAKHERICLSGGSIGQTRSSLGVGSRSFPWKWSSRNGGVL
jgi:hypothetical protein